MGCGGGAAGSSSRLAVAAYDSCKLFSSMAPSLPDRLGAGERGRDVARARLRLRRSRTRAATAVRTILALNTTISRPLGRLLFAVFYSPPLQSMIDRLDNPRITLG